MALALAFISSLAMTAALIHLLRKTRIGQAFLDFPKARGLHTSAVPKVGGIAMFASVWLLAGFWWQRDAVSVIAGISLVLLAISIIDDLRPLPAALRLLVHTAAAVLLILWWLRTFGLLPVGLRDAIPLVVSPLNAIVIALAIVWLTNLYNFMDGADGLAGGMSVIGFGTYAVALATLPNSGGSLGPFAASLAGAACGFLVFNFPPAKVFLGDAGSIPLGFLAIALGLHGSLMHLWPWWFAFLIFSPFIVDASATLLRRTLRGRKPWVAHRDNYYQRLILSGWGRRRTAVAYYGLMLAAAGSALGAMHNAHAGAILLVWVITYAVLLLFLEWRLHEKEKQRNEE